MEDIQKVIKYEVKSYSQLKKQGWIEETWNMYRYVIETEREKALKCK